MFHYEEPSSASEVSSDKEHSSDAGQQGKVSRAGHTATQT